MFRIEDIFENVACKTYAIFVEASDVSMESLITYV